METKVKPATRYEPTTARDGVARIVARWRTERPDLDPSPMLIVGRIGRLAQVMDAALRPPFADAGLGNGEFDILAALRRAGRPYARTPSQLQASLMVTGGAVTKQVDRLVAKGLVTRELDPSDRRGRRVALTDSGVAMVDDLIGTHLANEQRLLAALTHDQVTALEHALAVLAEELDPVDD